MTLFKELLFISFQTLRMLLPEEYLDSIPPNCPLLQMGKPRLSNLAKVTQLMTPELD